MDWSEVLMWLKTLMILVNVKTRQYKFPIFSINPRNSLDLKILLNGTICVPFLNLPLLHHKEPLESHLPQAGHTVEGVTGNQLWLGLEYVTMMLLSGHDSGLQQVPQDLHAQPALVTDRGLDSVPNLNRDEEDLLPYAQ
jgi:hypothetical protein